MKILSPMVRGFSQERASRFEAKQLEGQAKQVQAQGTARADTIRRQTQGILGQVEAAQVAGGGSASDAQAIRQQATVADRGAFNALAQIYQAEEIARGKRLQGKARRLEGKIAKSQGIMEGAIQASDQFTSAMTGGGGPGNAFSASTYKPSTYGF